MDATKRLLDDWREDDFECRLDLSEDELECYFSLLPSGPLSLTPDSLTELLKTHGVEFGVDAEAVAGVCNLLEHGKPVSDVLIASGRETEAPEDATVAFEVQPSSDVPRYEKRENGTVNYHRAHLFENVRSGETVGMLVPRKEGCSGCTVLGTSLPVPELREMPPPQAGENVNLTDDGRFIATCDGRVVFEDATVSVSDQLYIEGDVDYGCGDIDFVGYVHIKRSVREGFTVRAEKGLVIEHVVENVSIESDGDIQVGGVAGDGVHGVVRCGGNFSARYLHEVHVECAGNLVVSGEIMNCHLIVGGSIMAALLSGGTAYASAGFDVRRLGSDSGAHTYVRAGVGYDQVESMQEVDIQLDSLLQQKKELLSQEGQAQDDALESIRQRLDDLAAVIEVVEEARAAAYEGDGEGLNAKVNVAKAIFEGVTIHLGGTQEEVKEYRVGAYSIIEHAHSRLAFLPFTPLERNALELERELLRKEREER